MNNISICTICNKEFDRYTEEYVSYAEKDGSMKNDANTKRAHLSCSNDKHRRNTQIL
jgi:hypothetical protein